MVLSCASWQPWDTPTSPGLASRRTRRHGHGTGISTVLRAWALSSMLRPHSHDAADSVDSALESSAEGIRALKISLVALGVTAVAQLVVVFLLGVQCPARRHHPQLLRCADRGPALGRLRPRASGGVAAIHLRIRPSRGSRRSLHRRDDRAVGGAGRLRVGAQAARPAADDQRGHRARRGRHRVPRQRARRDLPDPGRPQDRLGGARRRRCCTPGPTGSPHSPWSPPPWA